MSDTAQIENKVDATTLPTPDPTDDFLNALENAGNPFLEGGGDDEASKVIGDLQAVEAKVEPGSLVEEDAPKESAPPAETVEEKPDLSMLDGLLPATKVETAPKEKPKPKGLRDQVKDLSSRAEELEGTIAERDLRIQELLDAQEQETQRRAEAEKNLANRYSVEEYNSASDPKVKELDQKLLAAVKDAGLMMENAQSTATLNAHWARYVEEYQNASSGGDVQKFREFMSANFEDDAVEAIRAVARISSLVDDRAELISQNRSNHYQSVIGSWESRQKEVSEQLAGVGAMSEEEAKEAMVKDPANLNAIISFVANNDPDVKSRLEVIRKNTTAFAAGVRPFDIQDERWASYRDPANPVKLTEEGEKLRQMEVLQMEKSRQELPTTLATMWAAATLVPSLAKEVAHLRARLGDEQQEAETQPTIENTAPAAPRNETGALSLDQITDEMLSDPHSVQNPFLAQI